MKFIGNIPDNLRYTKEHEWVKLENDTAIIGITDYAQHALTDIVFVELPEKGKKVEQLKPLCIVESVKSVSDVFAPISGEVAEVNSELSEKPENINQDPYENGWIAKLKVVNNDELNNLMDSENYKKYLEGLKE
ncbi:glycine cleavage system protein H [Candidatus Woesearchaeota archaeon]|jgi:glycine cleavage system H protein|nr:glycine cleavage system protein H [Candidatus Woesearchaeota archaeon]|tara:strand:- start:9369 stop:9770 length:402 start_codon:yes stop_codon:yes gene_type:complete